ncbi:MAG: exosortase-associated EpsI family protein [Planctomycetota bacterium]|jgi:hypothetical protein
MTTARETGDMLYRGRLKILPPILSMLLLVGVALEWNAFHLPAGDLEPYHERIRDAVGQVPLRIGDWVGTEEDVPASAVDMLRPNVILSRRYQNSKTGTNVKLLLIHCRDTRDIRGHYPPICYEAHGWTLLESQPRDWSVGGERIAGMQYRFVRQDATRANQVSIYNFMVRPDGGIEREMPGLNRASEDRRLRALGGGQVQVLFDEFISREESDMVFQELMAPIMATIELIAAGVPK